MAGVQVNETTGNAIKLNSIYSNGALGIDAGLGSGVTRTTARRRPTGSRTIRC